MKPHRTYHAILFAQDETILHGRHNLGAKIRHDYDAETHTTRVIIATGHQYVTTHQAPVFRDSLLEAFAALHATQPMSLPPVPPPKKIPITESR